MHPIPLSGGVGKPPTKFSKGEWGGLDRASIFRGVLLGKEGVTFAGKGARGCSFYIRKLKSVMKKKGNFN